jgi:predicted transcriptional regulator
MTESISRPDFRVVVRILEALGKNDGPMRPTQLQQASGTNYSQFQRYLDLLAERGMVTVTRENDADRRLVSLTSKGQAAHAFLVKTVSEFLPRLPDSSNSAR